MRNNGRIRRSLAPLRRAVSADKAVVHRKLHVGSCVLVSSSRAGVRCADPTGSLGHSSTTSVAAAIRPIVNTLLSGPAGPPVRKSGPDGVS